MHDYLKPMLPAPSLTTSFKGFRFPVYASLMLEGVRATVQQDQFMSRVMRPIPNLYLQSLVRPWMNRLDGVLVVGAPNALHVFDATQSAVKSVQGRPYFRFYVYDYMPGNNTMVDLETGKRGFDYRYSSALQLCMDHSDDPDNCTTIVRQHLVENQIQLDAMEVAALSHGYSGLLVRQIDGPYKHGRCTQLEGYLLKVQSFIQSTAEIIGFTPYYKNTNRIRLNNIGRAVRSGAARGKTPMKLIGSLHVRDINTSAEFNLGSGLTSDERADLWDARDSLVGRVVRYKSRPVAEKDAPKIPIFLGLL